jgi:desampylase
MFLPAPPFLVIPKILYQRLCTEAMQILDQEICGLLLGHSGNVEQLWPARNVSPTPACAFEIDPASLVQAQRSARTAGLALLGCYHSHPNGVAIPSTHDCAQAALLGGVWLILAQGNASAYKSAAPVPGCDLVPLILT